MRSSARVARALTALGSVLIAAACAPQVTSAPRPSNDGATEGVVRLRRVLSDRVSLREPLTLEGNGDALVLTFATRGRDGIRLVIDPTSLATRESAPFLYEAHARLDPAPYLSREPARIVLERGLSMECFTDDGSVMAQSLDGSGTRVGERLRVSGPSTDVVGPPRIVAVDGNHVVVAFFASTLDGFELVAEVLSL